MRKSIVDRDILPAFENRQHNEITADDLRALCNKVDPFDGAADGIGGYLSETGFGGIRGVAGEAKRAPQAEDSALAKRLWDVSIAMTGIDPGLPAV